MSTQTAIFAALSPLVAGRVHPVQFPQPPAVPTWPAIRYTLISGVGVDSLCGTQHAARDDRLQIDVVAESYATLMTLLDSVRPALDAMPHPVLHQGEFHTFDSETKTYRALLDVIVYHSSSL